MDRAVHQLAERGEDHALLIDAALPFEAGGDDDRFVVVLGAGHVLELEMRDLGQPSAQTRFDEVGFDHVRVMAEEGAAREVCTAEPRRRHSWSDATAGCTWKLPQTRGAFQASRVRPLALTRSTSYSSAQARDPKRRPSFVDPASRDILITRRFARSLERRSSASHPLWRATRRFHDIHRSRVIDALDELVRLGVLGEMPGNRYRARKLHGPVPSAPSSAGLVAGVLQMTPRGFGFVGAEDGGPDVFVPPDAVGPALHGDRVEVAARPSPKGREGTVVTVLSRRNPRFTGTLEQHGKALVIVPDDPRLRGPILVLGKPPKEKRSHVAVIAELVRFPQSSDELASATVVEVLGVQGLTRVEVAKIKIREGVVEEFDEETLVEARAYGDRVSNADKADREDLRELDLVTIDPPDARDHDDAVFVERTKGGYRVVVAIADVAHYVRPGTALDRTALARGCSIYLPDRAIPMLPPELSTNLASLVPNKDRLCLGVEIQLRKNGSIASHRLFEGVMKSGGHLTYDGVARALGLTEEPAKQPAAEKRLPMLHVLAELAKKLRAERLHRGALDFDLPEAKVKLDEANVEPIDCVRSRKDLGIREAYRMIEELMLLANEVVAAELKRRAVPAIYRIHGKPDEKKVQSFAKVASALGHAMDVEAARDPQKLSAFLREIEDTDEAPVLRYLLLRAMQQAAYDVNGDVGHFGLAAKDYLHFTSPIRRYPDLVVHRVVRSLVRNETVDGAALLPRMRRAAVEASRLERRAMQVELGRARRALRRRARAAREARRLLRARRARHPPDRSAHRPHPRARAALRGDDRGRAHSQARDRGCAFGRVVARRSAGRRARHARASRGARRAWA